MGQVWHPPERRRSGPLPHRAGLGEFGPAEFRAKVDEPHSLRRAGRHEELANLAAYLVSDFADYINGEVVTIDGGEWICGAGEMNMLTEMTPKIGQNGGKIPEEEILRHLPCRSVRIGAERFQKAKK
jgi:NAD(P)-dependent dehydrogenase (short-subunit alcohol dehydrogenase family)